MMLFPFYTHQTISFKVKTGLSSKITWQNDILTWRILKDLAFQWPFLDGPVIKIDEISVERFNQKYLSRIQIVSNLTLTVRAWPGQNFNKISMNLNFDWILFWGIHGLLEHWSSSTVRDLKNTQNRIRVGHRIPNRTKSNI